MNHIVEGLGVIGTARNGGSTKVAIIKARLLDSFAGKETKIKKMWPCLHQIETYLETQTL